MKNGFLLIVMLALTACAASRGFDRNDLRKRITYEDTAIADKDAMERQTKPRLPVPYKLAICFVNAHQDSEYGSSRNWMDKDKAKFLELGSELKNRGILSDAFVISDSRLEEGDYRAILSAAAQSGADAALIIKGAGSIDRYNNSLGISYLFPLSPLIVTGTEADALFMVSASLWDVRSRHLYISVEAEGKAKQIRPALFIRENQVVDAAKSDALAALRKELAKRMAAAGIK